MADKPRRTRRPEPAPSTTATDWVGIAEGWRVRRKSDGTVQVQSPIGHSSLTLSADQWASALGPLLDGVPAADDAADNS